MAEQGNFNAQQIALARRQDDTARTMASLETQRRRDELTPDFGITCDGQFLYVVLACSICPAFRARSSGSPTRCGPITAPPRSPAAIRRGGREDRLGAVRVQHIGQRQRDRPAHKPRAGLRPYRRKELGQAAATAFVEATVGVMDRSAMDEQVPRPSCALGDRVLVPARHVGHHERRSRRSPYRRSWAQASASRAGRGGCRLLREPVWVCVNNVGSSEFG